MPDFPITENVESAYVENSDTSVDNSDTSVDTSDSLYVEYSDTSENGNFDNPEDLNTSEDLYLEYSDNPETAISDSTDSEISDSTETDNSDNADNVNDSATTDLENTDGTDIQTIDSAETGTLDQGNNVDAAPENNGGIIDVDNDFGGDINSAIAAASNGDVVKLGSNTYNASNITIDKDITIDGQEGTLIDGNGTGDSIFVFTPDGTGATIQDLEIANGNNGIQGYGASNVTLKNLEIHDIGIGQSNRYGDSNTGISLSHADGLQISDTEVYNVDRKGVGIGDTDGVNITGLSVRDVNLGANHAQSHDAAGVKFYNTNNATISNSYFSNINANNIWNDTSKGTKIEGNVIENVGSAYLEPGFNDNIEISAIYDEKSPDSVVNGNTVSSVSDEFPAYNATEYTNESLSLGDNDFSSIELGTADYWTNEEAEKLIAFTENPDEAGFSLFETQYYATSNIEG
jgi:hypothetical protein